MSPLAKDLLFRHLLPLLVVAGAGFWLGTKLIAIHGLQMFKVLNIIGLSFDLLGVMLLSHFFSTHERFQAFVLGRFSNMVLLVMLGLPTGLFACAVFGPDGPSKGVVDALAAPILFYLMLPAIFYMTTFVVASEGESLAWRIPRNIRANLLGLFFVVVGLATQLVAAFQDLHAK